MSNTTDINTVLMALNAIKDATTLLLDYFEYRDTVCPNDKSSFTREHFDSIIQRYITGEYMLHNYSTSTRIGYLASQVAQLVKKIAFSNNVAHILANKEASPD